MDGAVTLRLLQGAADRDAIAARDAHARARGVNAVPTLILADQYVLPGAQPVALWQQVIDEIAQQAEPGGAEQDGTAQDGTEQDRAP